LAKRKKGKDEDQFVPPEPEEELPKERAPWKRIGLAVGVAIGINAALLPVAFVPIVGTVIAWMLTPYAAAFIGGKWLDRNKKGEWLSATFWVIAIWPTILTLFLISLVLSLGQFDLEFGFFGITILTMVYVFPLIFTLLGFFHGSRKRDGTVEKIEDHRKDTSEE
jgi:hypothetical protein